MPQKKRPQSERSERTVSKRSINSAIRKINSWKNRMIHALENRRTRLINQYQEDLSDIIRGVRLQAGEMFIDDVLPTLTAALTAVTEAGIAYSLPQVELAQQSLQTGMQLVPTGYRHAVGQVVSLIMPRNIIYGFWMDVIATYWNNLANTVEAYLQDNNTTFWRYAIDVTGIPIRFIENINLPELPWTGPVIEEITDHTPRLPPPPAPPIIPLLPMNTSLPNTLPSVDLGSKGVKPLKSKSKKSFDMDDLGAVSVLTLGYQGVMTSATNKRRYQFLQPLRPHTSATLRTSAAPGATAALCMLNMRDQTKYDKMPGFNNLWLNELIAVKTKVPYNTNTEDTYDAQFATTRQMWNILDPIYSATANEGLESPGAPTAGVLFHDQMIEQRFKNLTAQFTDFAHGPGPVYLTVYLVKLNKEIYYDLNPNQTAATGAASGNAPITEEFKQGFTAKYKDWTVEEDGGDAAIMGTGVPAASLDQDLPIGLMDNAAFDENMTVLGKQSVVLCPGQEATLKWRLKQDQFMSYAYRDKAMNAHNIGAADASVIYVPQLHRKGEMCFLVSLHGGVHGVTAVAGNKATNAVLQQAHIGYFVTQKLVYRMVRPYQMAPRLYDAFVEETHTGNNADVDV
jgi:hypothetical protein